MSKERQVSDHKIQLHISAAGAQILYRKLGLRNFIKVVTSLLNSQMRGEPWKGMPHPVDEKERISRIEIRDAVILYRILKDMYDEKKALEVVGEVVSAGAIMLFDYLLDPINLNELIAMTPGEQHSFIKRNLDRFPNAVTTIEHVSPEKVEFTVTKCHLADLCRKLNHPELAPVFCAADKFYFEETVGVIFKRENTIADGAKTCDFALKKRDNSIKFNLYRPREGDPDLYACHREALDLSESIKAIILKDIDADHKDRLKTITRQAKSYRTSMENYLINKKRYRKGNHNFRPLYVIWTILNSCNFRCSYCDNHQGELYPDIADPDRLDTEEGKKLLKIMRTGTSSIYWCGGEPMLRNDLPELLDYACDLGYFPNIINTNGTLIHKRLQHPGWSKFLYQMDIIVVSVDGLNIGRLNDLWVTKNARQVFVNLLLLKELQKHASFKLSVNCVIMPDAIEEAKAVLDLACDLDLWFVPVPVNFKHEPNKELINNKEYIDFANLILSRKEKGYKIIGTKGLLKKLLFAEPYQCLTTLKPHVWSNGNIAYPCRAAHNIPPREINLLDYNSFDEAYEAGRKFINPDFFHGEALNQCGGNCAWMQNYTTHRYGQGLQSLVRSGIISEAFNFVAKKD